MITFSTVHSIAYYHAQYRQAQSDARELGAELSYFDDDATSSRGTLLRLLGPLAIAASKPNSDPFKDIVDGDEAIFDIVQRLAAGQSLADPNKTLTRATGKPVVAFDVQMSMHKGLAVLALMSDPEIRDLILAAHDGAVEKVMRLAASAGLIITRRGAQSAIKEPAAEVVAAAYRHLTSRANDPQVHTHFVIFNLCRRDDGHMGAIDNHRLLQFGGALAALYRCEIVSTLSRLLPIEVSTRPGLRDFTIAGMPKEVLDLFSKRRLAILARAQSIGILTSEDREAAQILSLETRQPKDHRSALPSLAEGWHRELAAAGYTIAEVWSRLEQAAGKIRAQAPKTLELFQRQNTAKSIELLRENSIVLTEADITRVIAESRQDSLDAAGVLSIIPSETQGFLALPAIEQTMRRFVHADDIRLEHSLLVQARDRRDSWHAPSAAAIDAVLEDHLTATEEQQLAVRHMLDRDGISLAEGSAGSGKSFSTGLVRQILDGAGYKSYIVAPSWRGARVASHESGISASRASALAAFIVQLRKGRVSLTSRDVVIVDEAGMAGLRDIATLADFVSQADAKLILTGDTRQLQPVAAGAPMQSLKRVLGTNRVDQIRRQHQGWMRQASMMFAQGRADDGIEAYSVHGDISFGRTRAETISAAAQDYLRKLGTHSGLGADRPSPSELLLITAQNGDVRELNAEVRAGLLAQGYLGGEQVEIEALPRGTRSVGLAVKLQLAVHDRVIFGERLTIQNHDIFNSDIATVTRVCLTDSGPRLEFLLDRRDDANRPISVSASVQDLISENVRFGRSIPQLQHAYAVTAYAAQGATVDRTIVVNLHRAAAEETYVAFTRHRHDLSVHVDASRLLGLSKLNEIEFRRSHYMRGPSDQAAQESEHGLDANARAKVLAELKREAMTRDVTCNPSDFLSDLTAWLASDRPVEEFKRQLAPKTPADKVKVKLGQRSESGSEKRLAKADSLRFSPAELKQLSTISIREALADYFDCKAVEGGRYQNDRRLHKGPKGVRLLAVGPDRDPVWSRSTQRLLKQCNGQAEHLIVQMAIIFLRKSLARARSWVRQRFKLFSLNPFASMQNRQGRANELAAETVEAKLATATSLHQHFTSPAFQNSQYEADFEETRDQRLRHLKLAVIRQFQKFDHGLTTPEPVQVDPTFGRAAAPAQAETYPLPLEDAYLQDERAAKTNHDRQISMGISAVDNPYPIHGEGVSLGISEADLNSPVSPPMQSRELEPEKLLKQKLPATDAPARNLGGSPPVRQAKILQTQSNNAPVALPKSSSTSPSDKARQLATSLLQRDSAKPMIVRDVSADIAAEVQRLRMPIQGQPALPKSPADLPRAHGRDIADASAHAQEASKASPQSHAPHASRAGNPQKIVGNPESIPEFEPVKSAPVAPDPTVKQVDRAPPIGNPRPPVAPSIAETSAKPNPSKTKQQRPALSARETHRSLDKLYNRALIRATDGLGRELSEAPRKDDRDGLPEKTGSKPSKHSPIKQAFRAPVPVRTGTDTPDRD